MALAIYVTVFQSKKITKLFELRPRDAYEFIGLAFATVIFFINYSSFNLIRCEKKRIQREQTDDALCNEIFDMSSEDLKTNWGVKFVGLLAAIQKKFMVFIINYMIFRTIENEAQFSQSLLVLMKTVGCYFLSSFYSIGKLYQGFVKVRI